MGDERQPRQRGQRAAGLLRARALEPRGHRSPRLRHRAHTRTLPTRTRTLLGSRPKPLLSAHPSRGLAVLGGHVRLVVLRHVAHAPLHKGPGVLRTRAMPRGKVGPTEQVRSVDGDGPPLRRVADPRLARASKLFEPLLDPGAVDQDLALARRVRDGSGGPEAPRQALLNVSPAHASASLARVKPFRHGARV